MQQHRTGRLLALLAAAVLDKNKILRLKIGSVLLVRRYDEGAVGKPGGEGALEWRL